jgi:hypothetical protein
VKRRSDLFERHGCRENICSESGREFTANAEEVREPFEERMRRLLLYRKEDWPYEFNF